MSYLTEFDLHIDIVLIVYKDIVLIVYMFCAKILIFKGSCGKIIKKVSKCRGRSVKSRKHRNARRDGKLHVKYLEILEANTIKQAEKEKKNKKKRVPQTREKTSQNQALQQKSYQRDKHLKILQ